MGSIEAGAAGSSPKDSAAKRRKAWSYIRLSSAAQAKGHGKKRQMDGAARYCREHNLDLQEHLYDDASAWKKEHRKPGTELHRFLTAIADGTVPPGSVLIVESLDRLDRPTLLRGLSNLEEIVERDISIVSLKPLIEFTKDNLNELGLLLQAAVVFSRGNDESSLKADRLSEKWEERRIQARLKHKPMSSHCPLWLRLSKDGTQYEIDENRADIVRQIFQYSADGMGTEMITRRLNEEGKPAFRSKKGWRESSVEAYLKSRAVLGEMQPHKSKRDAKGEPIGKQRVPDGGPIPNFFPQIVSEELFIASTNARASRKVAGRGRKSGFANLAQSLCYCEYCEQGGMSSKMKLEKHSKEWSYLVCDASRRSLGCGIRNGWRYSDFERLLLTFITRINLTELLHKDDTERTTLLASIYKLDEKIKFIQAENELNYKVMHDNRGNRFLQKKFNELEKQEDETKRERDEKQAELDKLTASAQALAASSEEIDDLIQQLRGPTDNVFRLRAKVAQQIRSLIKRIDIACIGGDHGKTGYFLDGELVRIVPGEGEFARWFTVTFTDDTKTMLRHRRAITLDDYGNPMEDEYEIVDIDEAGMAQVRHSWSEAEDSLWRTWERVKGEQAAR